MRHLKSILLALAVSAAVLAAIGYFLSPRFQVRKSVVIGASPEQIFQYTGQLKRWPEWTAWNNQRYTSLKLSYGGPAQGVGSWQKWEAEDNENGEIQITGWEPSKKTAFQVKLDEHFTSSGIILLEPGPAGTKVSWTMEGDVGNNLISRYFILFADKLMASDLETGLANLQRICEKKRKQE